MRGGDRGGEAGLSDRQWGGEWLVRDKHAALCENRFLGIGGCRRWREWSFLVDQDRINIALGEGGELGRVHLCLGRGEIGGIQIAEHTGL